ncbi:MAG: corrinoid protein [Ignavibacteriaceae bacterium]|nr:corrinoid protein [Ignavibacteriaceae bacterium]
MNEIEALLKILAQTVIDGKKDDTVKITNRLLELNYPPKQILDEGLLPGMEVVGVRFRDNIIFVPQVLISARAMKAALSIVEPLLSEAKIEGLGTIVIGTVKGDIHDIGKNIVTMMLRSSGFKVIDLGIDVSVDKFLDAINKENPVIVGMSALLTTTMVYMKIVIDKIKQNALPVKVMIGGAPISKRFADQIGADAYAKNASEAVIIARELIGINK